MKRDYYLYNYLPKRLFLSWKAWLNITCLVVRWLCQVKLAKSNFIYCWYRFCMRSVEKRKKLGNGLEKLFNRHTGKFKTCDMYSSNENSLPVFLCKLQQKNIQEVSVLLNRTPIFTWIRYHITLKVCHNVQPGEMCQKSTLFL